MSLNLRAAGRLVFLLMVMGALLFLPAWTLDYWQAWVFLVAFGASALAITVYLMKEDPALLERRMLAGPTAEKDAGQRIASSIASVGFVAILVVSAFDHRARWSTVPRTPRLQATFSSRSDLRSCFLYSKKIRLPRPPLKWRRRKRSYRLDHTRSCGTRCTVVPLSFFLRCR